ncbi:uncharacterized protein LOC127000441 [Eriocheir sinensis]|uniref:uncharacterized protein LOC127000441 n=1 Tax=Eriocheir sinensis TaxID=95602 RepID=UPI0021C894D2|nr:uncharacterized protein LOC127000441 [Eriocheir sinensis]
MLPPCVIIVLGMLACVSQGFEVIENFYKGERYEAKDLSHLPYSSSLLASASSSPSGPFVMPHARKVDGVEGRDLTFSGLMEQLGLAFQEELRADPSTEQSRKLDSEGKKVDFHYHFYPHNQHLFNLPECATQQVCNAVYRRLNFTQPLCQCPKGSDPCSASLLSNDQRSIELSMGGPHTKATTVIKTCEPVWSVRDCRAPRDWSILALQNTRTGKAHYLVICKCPQSSKLEGPLNHEQPSYAQVPSIRVYGMMCIGRNYRRATRQVSQVPAEFPWEQLKEALKEGTLVRDLDLQKPSLPYLPPY